LHDVTEKVNANLVRMFVAVGCLEGKREEGRILGEKMKF
jgi:hypothetical protein